jgi:hypothetical protein
MPWSCWTALLSMSISKGSGDSGRRGPVGVHPKASSIISERRYPLFGVFGEGRGPQEVIEDKQERIDPERRSLLVSLSQILAFATPLFVGVFEQCIPVGFRPLSDFRHRALFVQEGAVGSGNRRSEDVKFFCGRLRAFLAGVFFLHLKLHSEFLPNVLQ